MIFLDKLKADDQIRLSSSISIGDQYLIKKFHNLKRHKLRQGLDVCVKARNEFAPIDFSAFSND